MDQEIVKKGDLELEIKEGNLVLSFDSKGVKASVTVESGYFLDKLAEKIPGQIDDAVIAVIKSALKAA